MPSTALFQANSMQRPDRTHEITAFLLSRGWGRAKREYLAGDASFRRYERVFDGDRQAVLMDAPPPFEDVRPFMHVTGLIGAAGLSAPAIIESDTEEGFLLLEDLGDASFSRVLLRATEEESTLYMAAMDALLMLQKGVLPRDIPPYDAAVYLREVSLFSDWFMPQVLGLAASATLRSEYLAIWEALLADAQLASSVMVHRDYHADNLLWLPNRQGPLRVGMIDYQDALVGDPFYDVVSLLEDARRDVAADTVDAAFEHFINGLGISEVDARRRFCILGAQRNLKIIGIFTRLAVRDGKAHYLSFLPRVWGHLMRDLQHPAMKSLRTFLDTHIPLDARGAIVADASIGTLVL